LLPQSSRFHTFKNVLGMLFKAKNQPDFSEKKAFQTKR